MARNQEKKTPVIVVKKRRVISPPPVVDKTETVIPPVPEVAAPPAAADAQLPAPIQDASPAPAAVGKKRKTTTQTPQRALDTGVHRPVHGKGQGDFPASSR